MSAKVPELLNEEFLSEGIVVEQYKPSWDELEIKNDGKCEISIVNSDITNCLEIIKNLSDEEKNSVLIVCNTIKKATFWKINSCTVYAWKLYNP